MKAISLAVRLFANMVAGHLLLKILGSFCCLLIVSSPTAVSGLTIFALWGLIMMLIALEVFIAYLQAYVIVFLIATYLNEATAASGKDH